MVLLTSALRLQHARFFPLRDPRKMPLEVVHREKQCQECAAYSVEAQVDVLRGVVVVLQVRTHAKDGHDLQHQTRKRQQASKRESLAVARRTNYPVDETTEEVAP